jgi:hypothetical protein
MIDMIKTIIANELNDTLLEFNAVVDDLDDLMHLGSIVRLMCLNIENKITTAIRSRSE